jgi:hypothetical protein
MNHIFIEAESFSNKGGWVVDTASMENIHSAYLMAHGMGEPVDDAVTEFDIPDNGEYNIWALTRDWTSVWNVKDSAGKFNIKIDGTELENTLGTNGKEWAWQFAGKTLLKKGRHTIALHDLTGFNGRCDAIYITDSDEHPSSRADDIDALRQALNWKALSVKEKKYDLEKHAKRLDVILEKWDDILRIIDEEIPSVEEFEAIMDAMEAPKSMEEIGMDPSILPMTFKATKDIRDKYILPRLFWDLGVLDEICEKVF